MSLSDRQPGWRGRRLTDHSCSQTVGSTDTLASLQPQEVTCCLITCLLPCTSSRLCNLRLNRADLAGMSHLSLMCVHYWWERKEAEILTGCETNLLSMALSQCIRWRHLLLPSLQVGKLNWAYILREGLYCLQPLQNVNHSEHLWEVSNWCRSYFNSLVDCCLPLFGPPCLVHLSSIHLAIILLSVPCVYCDWKKSPFVVKSLSDLFKVLVCLGFVSCPISGMWFPFFYYP